MSQLQQLLTGDTTPRIGRVRQLNEKPQEKSTTGSEALSPRYFHCLRKIATTINPKPEDFTSLTMFHLVEMDLAQRDPRGNMILTRRGASLLGSEDAA